MSPFSARRANSSAIASVQVRQAASPGTNRAGWRVLESRNNAQKKTIDAPTSGAYKNLLSGSTITEAARRAGYSEKNLAQSGHQALKAIRLRMPELMDDAGLTERTLIEKYLVPVLSAKNTKYFQYRGKVTDKRTVPDNDTRLRALETALKLRVSYSSAPQEDAAQTGVKVIVIDIPRPQRGVVMPDILAPVQAPNHVSSNGHKPDSSI
jgi:hypothetical protein